MHDMLKLIKLKTLIFLIENDTIVEMEPQTEMDNKSWQVLVTPFNYNAIANKDPEIIFNMLFVKWHAKWQ